MSHQGRFSLRRIAAPALAVAMILTAAACGDSDGSGSSGASSSPTYGGELTIVSSGNMTSWDPGSASGSFPGLAWDRLYAVYGTLVSLNTDGEIQTDIAESLATSDNGTTWTLKLRSGVTFTDGQVYDAEAVKFNWDRIAASSLGGKTVASSFASTVVDATTLTLTPKTADPVLNYRIAESIPFIASPASLKSAGDTYTTPIGAGPFVLVSTDSAVGETMEANKNYYDEGKPYLDKLIFSIVTDPAQRISTVVQGGAEIMNGYPFQFGDDADNPAVATYAVASGGIRHFVFNTQAAPFNDVRARRAAAMAINATELMQTLTQDTESTGSSTLFPTTSEYYDASLTLPETDLTEAQKLIDEVIADGVSPDVEIVVPAAPENVRVGELLQISLSKLKGLNVTVKQVPLSDWRTTTYQNDDFSITPYPGVFDLAAPQVAMSNLFGVGGTDNFANFDNAEMNAALAEARTASTDAERQAALKKVQEVYIDQVPIVIFGADQRTFLYRAEVGGMESMGRGALRTDQLYLSSN